MTVHAFPAHRVVRHLTQQGQPVTPLALLFIPARLWVAYVTWWIDIASGDSREMTFHIGRINDGD